MNKFLSIAFSLLLWCGLLSGQTVTIGSGTSTGYYLPVNSYFGYSYTQQIVYQSEIAASGTITKISFYMVGGVSLSNSNNWTIYMGHTAKTAFTSTTDWVPYASLTQVYSGTIASTPSAGWYEITLATPFVYNNTDNLVVAVDENASSYNGSTAYARIWSATPSNRALYYRNDNTNPDPTSPPTATSLYSSLNQMQLTIESSSVNPPNCANAVSPADAATNVLTTATLNWSSGGGLPTGYKLYFGTDNPPSNIVNGTDLGNVTTYDPTPDMGYSTTYYWKIVPYNANGEATGCSVWSFTTMADPTITTFPYTESFDGTTFAPLGWTNVKTAGDGTGTWDRITSGSSPVCIPYSGAGMARFYCYSYTSGTKGILATPPINFPSDNYKVSFWMNRDNNGSTSADLVNVYYNTTNSLTGATLLGTVNRSMALAPVVTTAGWYNYEFSMPTGAVGNGRYIIFEGVSAYGYNIFIDHVSIISNLSAPNCAVLTSPADAATNVTASVTLNWTSGGGIPTGYKLFYGTDNPPTNIANGTDLGLVTTYDPTPNPSYSTTYYWKIVPYNANGEATGCSVWSFTTMADPTVTTFPYTESFDGTTFAPFGWTNVKTAGTGTGTWDRQTSGTNPTCSPNSGAGMARFNSYNYSSGTKGILATPPMNFSTDNYRVKFWMYRDNGSSSLADLVNVYYNTTNSLTGATLLGTVNRSMALAPVVTTAGWYNYEFAMPSGAAGNERYIIFEGVSAYGTNIFIDDVTVEAIPTTTLSWYNLQWPGTATITEDQNVTIYAQCWQDGVTNLPGAGTGIECWIGYSTSNTNPNTWTNWVPASFNIDAGNNDEYMANLGFAQRLLPGTYYFASKWRYLGGLYTYGGFSGGAWDGATNISGVLTINPLTISTVPHTENFDGVTAPSLPAGWRSVVSSTSTSATLVSSTSTPNSSPNNIYMYNASDASATLILVSPMVVPALNTLRVKFYSRASTAGYTIQVGTMDSQTGTFTSLQSVTLTTTNAQYTVDFSTYAGSDKYIAFKHGLGGTYRSIYLDDVLIEAIPTTPVFSVSPASKNFGAIQSGTQSANQTFTVTNTGTETLSVSGTSLTGANAGDFTITDGNTYPVDLATNQTLTVNVAFTPGSAGTKSANLSFTSNYKTTHDVALSGEAYTCDALTPPYSENFDGVTAPAIPQCVTVTNDNGDAYTWKTYSTTYHSSPNSMYIRYNSSLAMDDWFFSKPLSLEAGKNYRVTFYYMGASATYTESLEVKWGDGPSAAQMTGGQLLDIPSMENITWLNGEGILSPSASGTYYIGWHGYSEANMYNIYIDDISVSEVPSATTWTGTTNNSWTTASNWSLGVPGASTDVTIPSGLSNYPTVGAAASVKSISMGNGATLLGFNLLSVSEGASLVRNITGNSLYHLIASPVQNVTTIGAFPSNQNNIWIRRFDEPTGYWINLTATDILSPGEGYSFFMDIASTSASFDGQFNVGNGSYIAPTLSFAGTYPGYGRYNLLGNPYPACLDWDLGTWNKTELEASVWVWDATAGAYVSWNGSVGSLTNGVIPVAQGFFVKVTDAATAPSISIPINATCHSNTSFYKEEPANVLRLDVTNNMNTYSNSLFIQYTENATNGFDPGYDTRKRDDMNETPELWALAGETRVSIDALPSVEQCSEVNVWFKPGVNGQYTLKANGIESFTNDEEPWLTDKLTGVTQNLKTNPVYTFYATPATATDRFKIAFSGVGIQDRAANEFSVISTNGQITVLFSSAQSGVINITNLTGQKLYSRSFSSCTKMIAGSQFSCGIYLVTVINSQGTVTRKVIVK